jgi:hypothetical protein
MRANLQLVLFRSLFFAASLHLAACSAGPTLEDGGDRDGQASVDGSQMGIDAIRLPDGNVIIPDVPNNSDGISMNIDTPNASDANNPPTDAPNGPCRPVSCGGHVNECGDCVDNDRDGLIDERDPECLGPCDNTEGPVLLTGVGGEAGGPCMSDCYFDFGNGAGNDDCNWDHRCDPLEVAPGYFPEGMACAFDRNRVGGRTCPAMQSRQCLNFCRPITPNGCDCFGCCTFPQIQGRPAAMGGEFVWLGSRDNSGAGSCTLAAVTNTAACHPCTPVADCFNDCGECEVCLGRPMPPAHCFPPPPQPDGGVRDGGPTPDGGVSRDGGMPASQCPPGIQACGLPGQAPCPINFYCTTGCCIPIPN